MLVAVIDRDEINKDDPEFYRVGKTFSLNESDFKSLFTHVDHMPDVKVRWRTKDDDGEIYYGGWLYNDQDCEVQFEVLRWAMHDAGCTTIEVKEPDGSWRQEIG